MISIDTNLLLYSFSKASPHHAKGKAFVDGLALRDDVALSEFVLSEFYLHLRNSAVLQTPLDAPAAAAVIQSYRQHPRWRVVGFPPRSRTLHSTLWKAAAQAGFPRRRVFDLRIALCLQAFGVSEFATANVKDFEDTGFTRVWNPLLA